MSPEDGQRRAAGRKRAARAIANLLAILFAVQFTEGGGLRGQGARRS